MFAFMGGAPNPWPAVQRLDSARVYRLALDANAAGWRFHALRRRKSCFATAARIGKHFAVPVVGMSKQEAAEHFGWLAFFAGLDVPASSALARERLGW